MSTRRLVLSLVLVSLLSPWGLLSAPPLRPGTPRTEKALFAGGCFWCMEPPFEKLDGALAVVSGYTGGTKANPTYEEVSSGTTGHAEAVEVLFDPARVSYEKLLSVFWHNVDPTAKDRQFCDSGRQYRSAIFVRDDSQRSLAEESKRGVERLKAFPGPIVTEIVEAGPFWPAEEYHQGYWKRNPVRYRYYRSRCGRDERLGELWGAEAGH